MMTRKELDLWVGIFAVIGIGAMTCASATPGDATTTSAQKRAKTDPMYPSVKDERRPRNRGATWRGRLLRALVRREACPGETVSVCLEPRP